MKNLQGNMHVFVSPCLKFIASNPAVPAFFRLQDGWVRGYKIYMEAQKHAGFRASFYPPPLHNNNGNDLLL